MSSSPAHHHPAPFAPHFPRQQKIGKPRRPVGDPVAPLKEITRFEPIPHPAPQQLAAPLSIFDPASSHAAQEAGELVFHCAGDTGGIHGTDIQEAIAVAMEGQIHEAPEKSKPRFFYILGDVIYFNGQQRLYKTEFYEPYQFYPAPIFAIPGNHDGDTHVQKGDKPDTEPSLFGFFKNFCDFAPHHASPYRMSMTQPYPYWTLDAPFVTIIGLYSNVEGSLDARGRADQQHFLETQLKAADKNKKLLVTVHHPPFSLDSAHGGCPDILNALDRAVAISGRAPDAVLSGHVHNYQRFSRKLPGGGVIPYIVAGAAGYANTPRSMHKLQKELHDDLVAKHKNLPYKTTMPDVALESYQQEEPGFLRVTVNKSKILFEYFTVSFATSAVALFDSVTA